MNNKKIIVALVSVLIGIGALTTNCYGRTRARSKRRIWRANPYTKIYMWDANQKKWVFRPGRVVRGFRTFRRAFVPRRVYIWRDKKGIIRRRFVGKKGRTSVPKRTKVPNKRKR